MNDQLMQERAQASARYVQEWLQYAPKPPLRGDNSHDVFISYRSSDRAWAMALYDILKLAGWDPFLDQYDLVPGANLETSLTENLQASSSGVILWSSRTKDSDWCQRERQSMTTLRAERKDSNQPFHYVFAKLDTEQLPLFARRDLYVDFAESPEGPRGVNLLMLMCGMRGIALPPQAVVAAQTVDQDAKKLLDEINGLIEAANPARLEEIAASDRPGLLASPGPILKLAQGLISMARYEEALRAIKHADAFFPQSIRARQLEGLALRRLKRYQQAIDVLSVLKAAGHQDPETMGILAAAWDGLYQESGKKLHLRKSRDLYLTAFQSDPKNEYTGVNAASKSLFLGETQEAERLAGEVLPLVNTVDGNDFYKSCTLAEVYLLQHRLDDAAALYQKVIDKHSNRTGDLEGTRQQATRICGALNLPEEVTKKMLSPFDLLQ
jgi:tetratricopeptide (TPR) repeat protein